VFIDKVFVAAALETVSMNTSLRSQLLLPTDGLQSHCNIPLTVCRGIDMSAINGSNKTIMTASHRKLWRELCSKNSLSDARLARISAFPFLEICSNNGGPFNAVLLAAARSDGTGEDNREAAVAALETASATSAIGQSPHTNAFNLLASFNGSTKYLTE
jgi:hypothetical protein